MLIAGSRSLLFMISLFFLSAQAMAAQYSLFLREAGKGPASTDVYACAVSTSNNGFVDWADYLYRCDGKWKYAWVSETENKFRCAGVTSDNLRFIGWTDYNYRCDYTKESVNYFVQNKPPVTKKRISRLPDDSQLVLTRIVPFPAGDKCITVKGKGSGFFGANNSCEICVNAESHNDRTLIQRTMIVKETELSDDGKSAVFTVVNDQAVNKISCLSDGQIDPYNRESLKAYLETMGFTLTLPAPEEF